MANLKLSSKMHIMIIVSVLVVAIGVAMGLIFQFALDGYFNYGAEYQSYNSVVVEYSLVELQDGENDVKDTVKQLCDKQFEAAGVDYYTYTYGEVEFGGGFTFRFSKNENTDNIKKAVTAIQAEVGKEEYSSGNASFHELETQLGASKALIFGAIALSSAVVLQFLYFAVRYKLTMAFSALLANVHNLAIFVSLLSITRVPVGSTVFAFGALTVLMTMIGCCFMFDKMRKNFKDESFAKRDAFEQVDICANSSRFNIAFLSVCIAAIALVVFVLLSISSLSVEIIITPVVAALLSALSSIYGTAFFTPAVYSRFKRIGDNFKAKHSKKASKKS